MTFEYWKNLSDSQNLMEFSQNPEGLMWLKVKSITRVEWMKKFLDFSKIHLRSSRIYECQKELYCFFQNRLEEAHSILDAFFRMEFELQKDLVSQEKLVSELYQLEHFDWGGDYQNSLDKYLVSRFVKTFYPYRELVKKCRQESASAVQGYVLNSWYNHWTSILIEQIFKNHPAVLPTLGQIKGVDFFIRNVPFDLKVTYFPAEYLKKQRKKRGLPNELTFLKQKARELRIPFSKNAKEHLLYYELTEKLRDRNSPESLEVLKTVSAEREEIIETAKTDPRELIQWLYEMQGEMRFGAENRLFLILVDSSDFLNSWKLKRNFDLLSQKINEYLNEFQGTQTDKMETRFSYKGKQYATLADAVFITK